MQLQQQMKNKKIDQNSIVSLYSTTKVPLISKRAVTDELSRLTQYDTLKMANQSNSRLKILYAKYVSLCEQSRVEQWYPRKILKYISNSDVVIQERIIEQECELIQYQQSYYHSISKIFQSRENCLRKLKTALNNITSQQFKEAAELDKYCVYIRHLRLLTAMLVENIQIWRTQLKQRTEQSDETKLMFQKDGRNILEGVFFDTLFLSKSPLRKYIQFSKLSDPLFLYPYQQLLINSSTRMKYYESVINLFTFSQPMLERLTLCNTILNTEKFHNIKKEESPVDNKMLSYQSRVDNVSKRQSVYNRVKTEVEIEHNEPSNNVKSRKTHLSEEPFRQQTLTPRAKIQLDAIAKNNYPSTAKNLTQSRLEHPRVDNATNTINAEMTNTTSPIRAINNNKLKLSAVKAETSAIELNVPQFEVTLDSKIHRVDDIIKNSHHHKNSAALTLDPPKEEGSELYGRLKGNYKRREIAPYMKTLKQLAELRNNEQNLMQHILNEQVYEEMIEDEKLKISKIEEQITRLRNRDMEPSHKNISKTKMPKIDFKPANNIEIQTEELIQQFTHQEQNLNVQVVQGPATEHIQVPVILPDTITIVQENDHYTIVQKEIKSSEYEYFFIRYYEQFTVKELECVKSLVYGDQRKYHHYYVIILKKNDIEQLVCVSSLGRDQKNRTMFVLLYKELKPKESDRRTLLKTYVQYIFQNDPCDSVVFVHHHNLQKYDIGGLLVQEGFQKEEITPFDRDISKEAYRLLRNCQCANQDAQQFTFALQYSNLVVVNFEKKILYSNDIEQFNSKNHFSEYILSNILKYTYQKTAFPLDESHAKLRYYIELEYNLNLKLKISDFKNMAELNDYLKEKGSDTYDTTVKFTGPKLAELMFFDSFSFPYLVNDRKLIFSTDNKWTFYAQTQNQEYVLIKLRRTYADVFIVFMKEKVPVEEGFKKKFAEFVNKVLNQNNKYETKIIKISFFKKQIYGRILDIPKKYSVFGNCQIGLNWVDYLKGIKQFDSQQAFTSFDSQFLLGMVIRNTDKVYLPIFATRITPENII